jgi:MoaA/NifB/PqqE/SkfB family radical SAM enzyme
MSERVELRVDQRFRDYFTDLHQVFLYITDDCNLRCRHCLYKPLLANDSQIPLPTALGLITTFRKMGATKLTIMGGEPTRYGHDQGYRPLLDVIRTARELGYERIRIDTNGQFRPELLDEPDFRLLDDISFSLDGHTPAINDPLRGRGSHARCVANLRAAVERGYQAYITSCIHRGNVGQDEDGRFLIDSMIRFAAHVGVTGINFHGIFLHGVARDGWIEDTYVSSEDYAQMYTAVRAAIDAGGYPIPVRLPQERLVTRAEFDADPAYFGYCPVKLAERVLVHPNGQIRICSLLIGTPQAVATFDDTGITWDDTDDNEITHGGFDLDHPTPCTNQTVDSGHIPVCVSFKPGQSEHVWANKLAWQPQQPVAATCPKNTLSPTGQH